MTKEQIEAAAQEIVNSIFNKKAVKSALEKYNPDKFTTEENEALFVASYNEAARMVNLALSEIALEKELKELEEMQEQYPVKCECC